jgi:K+-transporting ATPase ATPase C chain
MYSFVRHQLLPAFALLVALTVVTGIAYPAAVTAIAQVAFPTQANGSLIVVDGKTVGSTLIGQAFSDPKYLWGRPSAAGVTDANPGGYDANASGGSNLGPTNKNLIDRVTAAVDALRAANGNAPVPVDLVTTSGSGLDPEISPAAAEYQVARIAAARGIGEADVRAAIARHTEQPLFGFLGKPRVNVLLVNLDLDALLG